MISHTRRAWVGFLVVGLLIVVGCSRSPEAQKARHLERGDKYAARVQYREATLEYRNVLRYEANNARAIRQLGLAYYHLGEFGYAYRYLLKAQELTPNDLDVRLKLGAMYLLGGKTEEARQEANFVLEREPKNLDGLALLAGVASSSEEVDAAIQRLEAIRADFGD